MTAAGFCLRFADDFDVSWDDWKPDAGVDVALNAMVVPEGTYEVCSRTTDGGTPGGAPGGGTANLAWILSVDWQMKGLDIHLDTDIGRRLSLLGATLTSLAYDANAHDAPPSSGVSSTALPPRATGSEAGAVGELPAFLFDVTLTSKERARLAEKEMNRQARVVEALMRRPSAPGLAAEQRHLADLEAVVFHGFKDGFLRRLRRHGGTAGAQTMTWARDRLLPATRRHARSHSIDTIPSADAVTPTHSRALSDYVDSQAHNPRVVTFTDRAPSPPDAGLAIAPSDSLICHPDVDEVPSLEYDVWGKTG